MSATMPLSFLELESAARSYQQQRREQWRLQRNERVMPATDGR